MTISIIRIIGAVGAVIVTTAAVCNNDAGASASTPNASAAAAPVAPSTATSGSGLPADFPLPPGLSACKPLIIGPEVICDWHKLDRAAMHAMYTFYHDALPKAGYVLKPGSNEGMTPTDYMSLIGFKKGSVQGSVVIRGGDMTIQLLTHK